MLTEQLTLASKRGSTRTSRSDTMPSTREPASTEEFNSRARVPKTSLLLCIRWRTGVSLEQTGCSIFTTQFKHDC